MGNISEKERYNQKEFKKYNLYVAKTELEIYKAKTATDNLIDEIKEINLSEEKYRKIITKLKTKYREKLIEAIADVNEDIMEKYFAGEEITKEELKAAKWLDKSSIRSVKWLPADELLLNDIESAL